MVSLYYYSWEALRELYELSTPYDGVNNKSLCYSYEADYL